MIRRFFLGFLSFLFPFLDQLKRMLLTEGLLASSTEDMTRIFPFRRENKTTNLSICPGTGTETQSSYSSIICSFFTVPQRPQNMEMHYLTNLHETCCPDHHNMHTQKNDS